MFERMLDGLKKVPWEIWIGLGATVVVAYIVTKQSISAAQGSTSTTATGANAGAIDNTGLGQDIGTLQSQTLQAFEQQTQQNAANTSALQSTIGDAAGQTQSDISNAQAAITSAGSANTQAITGSIDNASSAEQSAIANSQTSLASDIAGVQTGVGNLQTSVGTLQTSVGNVQTAVDRGNTFAGWQFYQIPNRYTPFIPQSLNPTGTNNA